MVGAGVSHWYQLLFVVFMLMASLFNPLLCGLHAGFGVFFDVIPVTTVRTTEILLDVEG
jgi:hypothetical protein